MAERPCGWHANGLMTLMQLSEAHTGYTHTGLLSAAAPEPPGKQHKTALSGTALRRTDSSFLEPAQLAWSAPALASPESLALALGGQETDDRVCLPWKCI